MASRASGYYGDPFQGSHGFTQGDPLFPRLFNVVVDAIVRHWVGLVAKTDAGPDDFRYTVAEKADVFNADDGLVASANPVWLHWSFDVLIGLLGRSGLWTNMAKMVTMVC